MDRKNADAAALLAAGTARRPTETARPPTPPPTWAARGMRHDQVRMFSPSDSRATLSHRVLKMPHPHASFTRLKKSVQRPPCRHAPRIAAFSRGSNSQAVAVTPRLWPSVTCRSNQASNSASGVSEVLPP